MAHASRDSGDCGVDSTCKVFLVVVELCELLEEFAEFVEVNPIILLSSGSGIAAGLRLHPLEFRFVDARRSRTARPRRRMLRLFVGGLPSVRCCRQRSGCLLPGKGGRCLQRIDVSLSAVCPVDLAVQIACVNEQHLVALFGLVLLSRNQRVTGKVTV